MQLTAGQRQLGGLDRGSGDPNSGPHGCSVSILVTEPSPQLCVCVCLCVYMSLYVCVY